MGVGLGSSMVKLLWSYPTISKLSNVLHLLESFESDEPPHKTQSMT